MWVNKVPNVHVWADHTSVRLLLGICAGALSRRGHHLSGKIKHTYARTAKNDCFCLFVKSRTDRSLVQCLAFRGHSHLNLILNLKFISRLLETLLISWSQNQQRARFQTCSSTLNIFSSGFWFRARRFRACSPAIVPDRSGRSQRSNWSHSKQ